MINLEEFERIERELKLHTSTFFGFFWWDIWRYPLYDLAAGRDRVVAKSLSRPIKRLFCGLTRIAIFFNRKKSVYILRHPRFKLEGGTYVDIYTDLIGRHFSLLGYEPYYLEKQTVQNRSLDPGFVYPLDLLYSIAGLFSKFFPRRLLQRYMPEAIDSALSALKLAHPTSIKIQIACSVVNFKLRYILYRLIFKLKKPAALVLVVSCGNEDIICAARREGIVSIELQHGSPARGKLNYDYSNTIDKTYFPDVFLNFGPFFTDRIELPSSCKKIVDFGYPYLEEMRHRAIAGTEKKYDLLVISQPDCDVQITVFLRALIEHLPDDFSVLVQLHPQYFSSCNPYEELEGPNLTVRDSIESPLYEAFRASYSAITVYSTAIYEARAFGLKAFVLLDERNLMSAFLELAEGVGLDPMANMADVAACMLDVLERDDGNGSNLFSRYSLEKVESLLAFVDST